MSLSDCSVFNVNAIPDIFNVQRRIFLPPWKIHLYLRVRQVKPAECLSTCKCMRRKSRNSYLP